MVSYNGLKDKILSGTTPDLEEMKKYFENLLLQNAVKDDGWMIGACELCTRLLCLKREYRIGTPVVACVSLDGDRFVLTINPVELIRISKEERSLLFVLFHEISHVLYGHLGIYLDAFRDNCLAVIANIATDYVINMTLKGNMLVKNPTSIIPTGAICDKNITDFTGQKIEFRGKCSSSSGVVNVIDKNIKKVLGLSMNDIVLKSKLLKTTFCQEVFKVVEGEQSCVFVIKDKDEAYKLCKALSNYLRNPVNCVITISKALDGDIMEVGAGSSFPSDINASDISIATDSLDSVYRVLSEEMGVDIYGRGFSGNSERGLEYIEMNTRLSWESFLKRSMSNLGRKYSPSKKRLNRRRPDRLDLSGRLRKHRYSVVIAMDSSSSIGDDMYNYFLSEVKHLLKTEDVTVYLYEFTCVISKYTKIVDRNDLKKPETRYSGGTCFQPIFDALDKNEEINPRETVVVVLTDGMGEPYVDYKGFKNRIWVVCGLVEVELSCKREGDTVFPIIGYTVKGGR